jgi:signal transduction histidine kinase
MSNIKLSTQMLEINLKRLGLLDSEAGSIPRYFQILKDEGQREINLINNLLDLSRLDAKTEPVVSTEIDLHQWLPEVVKPFVERAHSQQQKFHLDIAENVPTLTTDLSELERILNELLNNACKYTPPEAEISVTAKGDGVVIESRSLEQWEQNGHGEHGSVLVQSITPVATSPHDRLILCVSNSGVEIPEGECDRIFDKFYRIPSSDPWKHGGTGLGLALVKGLVERLQGTISVESADGKTTFVVQLPLVLIGKG